MDEDGYPDTGELEAIAFWPPGDYRALFQFIRDRWAYEGAGYFRQEGNTYYLSTAGWSGYESIIEALERNKVFWFMCWVSSARGGHFRFFIPEVQP
jgi:hypothetical protein